MAKLISSHSMQRRAACAFLLMLLLGIPLLALPLSASAANGNSDWSPPVNFSQQPDLISTSPVLLCDRYQNTHAFWVESKAQQASIFYRNDASSEWSVPRDIIAAPSVLSLTAAQGPDNTIYLLWSTGLTGGDLVFTRAPLAGVSDPRQWSAPTTLANSISSGSLYVDAQNTLHLVYGQSDETARIHDLIYIRSTDGGATWRQPVTVLTVATPVSAVLGADIAVDQKGRLHVDWGISSQDYGVYSRLGYVRSVDNGFTWSAPIELASSSTAPGVAVPAVFLFGEDEVHLTWDEPIRRHQWSTDGGETWSKPDTIMELGAAFGGANKLAKDSADTLHVIAAVGEGVFHATWNGDGWNPREAVDTRSFDPHGQQLVVCQGNRLHVAYYDRTAENEIWYSSKTTNAPVLARTAITVSEPAAPPTTLVEADRSATRVSPTATPRTPSAFAPEPTSAPAAASAVTATIVGATTSAILVIGVVVAALSRRRR